MADFADFLILYIPRFDELLGLRRKIDTAGGEARRRIGSAGLEEILHVEAKGRLQFYGTHLQVEAKLAEAQSAPGQRPEDLENKMVSSLYSITFFYSAVYPSFTGRRIINGTLPWTDWRLS